MVNGDDKGKKSALAHLHALSHRVIEQCSIAAKMR